MALSKAAALPVPRGPKETIRALVLKITDTQAMLLASCGLTEPDDKKICDLVSALKKEFQELREATLQDANCAEGTLDFTLDYALTIGVSISDKLGPGGIVITPACHD